MYRKNEYKTSDPVILVIYIKFHIIFYQNEFKGEKFREVVKSSFRRKRRRRLSNNIELRIA